MYWNYEFLIDLWPLLLTVILLLGLAAYAWGRRTMPGALPFAAGAFFAALWATGALLEYAAQDFAAQVFWVKFQSAFQLPATTAIFLFILDYTRPGRWVNRHVRRLLLVIPLLALALLLTNDFHGLVWRGFAQERLIVPQMGAAAWFFVAYSYALAIVQFGLLVWLFMRSPAHRWPVAFMLTGQIVARLLFVVDITTLNRLHNARPALRHHRLAAGR